MTTFHATIDSVRETVLFWTEASRPLIMSTCHFITFIKHKDLYEILTAEINREPNTSISRLAYKASIDDAYLRMFKAASWVKASWIEDITEDKVAS